MKILIFLFNLAALIGIGWMTADMIRGHIDMTDRVCISIILIVRGLYFLSDVLKSLLDVLEEFDS